MLTLKNYKSILIIFFIAMNLFSQDAYSQNAITGKKDVSNKRKPVTMIKDNSPLSRTPVINYSPEEIKIQEEMNQIKRPDNFSQEGDKILGLQKRIEITNSSTITKQETTPIGKMIIPKNNTDNISSGNIFNVDYSVALATQVEQRGTDAGKVWVAVGLSILDTGAGATADTVAMYYSNDGGITFAEYVKIAFSAANKIDFDDLDMEIIENTSGTKYIYLVFGYYTNGYFGARKIGYLVISAPTLGYFGSTLVFPGQTASSKFFHPRITSDNARYVSNPYVTIVAMQDSTSGGNEYIMTKMCRVLSPYTLTPAFTYLPKNIYTAAAGFVDFGVTLDIAYFNNVNDSLVFLLSGYPGFNDKMYFYKAFSNNMVYPTSNGFISPYGDNMEYARIASNGGTDQTKMLVTYTDDYANSGDYDQRYLSSEDANNWIAGSLETSVIYNSRYGDVIGRRNADGSFSGTFKNYLGSLSNITSYRFDGNFNISSFIHCTNTEYANSIASPKPSFRFVNGDSCLSFWPDYFNINHTVGCSAINFYLKVTNDGYYNDVTNSVPVVYYMNVIIANQNPPYNHIDTAVIYPEPNLLLNEIVFKNAPDGDYYFILKSVNTLETWSANPITISNGTINFYDFTSSDAQAYGNNLKLKGTKWCIYSGDVDQDGIIDATDMSLVDNDAINPLSGYSITDLNGDYYTDATDVSVVDNNAFIQPSVMKPL